MNNAGYTRDRYIFKGEPESGRIHRIIYVEGGNIFTWSEIGIEENSEGWTWSGPITDFENLFVKV